MDELEVYLSFLLDAIGWERRNTIDECEVTR